MEVERKFLIESLPINLDNYHCVYLEQEYLSYEPEVRLRKQAEKSRPKYFLTVKSAGTTAREEYELEISGPTFKELQKASESALLKKIRYLIPLDSDLTAELDIYYQPAGLMMVEVEFTSPASAEAFTPPDWFGPEATDDKTYKNKNVCRELSKDKA